jgi:hypothetical protein
VKSCERELEGSIKIGSGSAAAIGEDDMMIGVVREYVAASADRKPIQVAGGIDIESAI